MSIPVDYKIPCDISEAVWNNALQNPARIVAIKAEATPTVWLKKSTTVEGAFGRWVLTKFSNILKLPMLQAVHQPGGREAIATEASRLQALAVAGVQVPELLWQNEEMVLISDLGRKLTNYLKQHRNNHQIKLDVVKQVFTALSELHNSGQYLSQAFARNVTVLENADEISIGFIDFEDDPLETMSLENAQARDLLLLIYSLSTYFDNCQSEYQALVTAQIFPLPENIKQQLRCFMSKFSWLSKLPGKGRLGNGYWRLTVITNVLRAGLEERAN
ncbi:MAG: hypothetical protein L3J24_02640 [Xanthomonadales bacterium]|nr:hypothetical protein [Xanthomonadales bacterium]